MLLRGHYQMLKELTEHPILANWFVLVHIMNKCLFFSHLTNHPAKIFKGKFIRVHMHEHMLNHTQQFSQWLSELLRSWMQWNDSRLMRWHFATSLQPINQTVLQLHKLGEVSKRWWRWQPMKKMNTAKQWNLLINIPVWFSGITSHAAKACLQRNLLMQSLCVYRGYHLLKNKAAG